MTGRCLLCCAPTPTPGLLVCASCGRRSARALGSIGGLASELVEADRLAAWSSRRCVCGRSIVVQSLGRDEASNAVIVVVVCGGCDAAIVEARLMCSVCERRPASAVRERNEGSAWCPACRAEVEKLPTFALSRVRDRIDNAGASREAGLDNGLTAPALALLGGEEADGPPSAVTRSARPCSCGEEASALFGRLCRCGHCAGLQVEPACATCGREALGGRRGVFEIAADLSRCFIDGCHERPTRIVALLATIRGRVVVRAAYFCGDHGALRPRTQ